MYHVVKHYLKIGHKLLKIVTKLDVVVKNAAGQVEGIKYYKCQPGAVEISPVTNKVYKITFTD